MFKNIILFLCLIVCSDLVAKDRIVKVGLVFDLSGAVSEAPLDVIRGVEFAQRYLEKEGVYLQLRKYDSGPDALGTLKAMKRALKDDLDFVIAEVYSSKAAVAAKLAEKHKRLMITPYATAPMVTKGKKYVFRSCFSDDFQSDKLSKFAMGTLKAKSSLVFYDATQVYSKNLAEGFKKSFENQGGLVANMHPMLGKLPSFKKQLDLIAKFKPDVIFLPTYENTASRFINEAVLRGFRDLTVLGGDGWGATQMFDDLVFNKKFPLRAYWTSHYSGNFSDTALKHAKHDYKSVSGKDFNASIAIGFDTAQIISRAVKIAGSETTQEGYRKAMHRMPAFRGLSGQIHFGGKQDPKKSVFVRKVDGDRMGYVAEIKP